MRICGYWVLILLCTDALIYFFFNSELNFCPCLFQCPMASGGFQPNKQGKPEPKRRSNWHRSVSSDRDDAQSLNSLPSDIRINNWVS